MTFGALILIMSTMQNPFDNIDSRLSRIEGLLIDLKHFKKKNETEDQWFDLNDLVTYDPEKRTKATFYRYVHHNEIPYHKRGKKLTFLKSEIDKWLKQGRKKTTEELSEDAVIASRS